jgi:hypothetical protein
MKRISKSAFLFGVIVIAPAFGARPIATVTSAEPFALDGHSVNTPGVSSFPVVLGDTVATARGSAVLKFTDGSAMKLGSNSSVRIAGVETKPKIVLLAGALDYKIVPGSGVSVTNLDSEHKAVPATAAAGGGGYSPQPSGLLHLHPGQIAMQAPVVQPPAVTADYLGADTTTLGSWKGKYGKDGEVIASDANNLPSYATISMMGNAVSTLQSTPDDPRALQSAGNGSTRIGSAFANNFTIDLNMTDGNPHKISFYLADFDNAGRAETFTIIDATTKATLSTQTFAAFSTGVYESWNIKGHVQIQVTSTGTGSAIVNGIFFDATVPGTPGSSGASEAAPNATHGLLTDPKFLIPLAGAAAAGLTAGLLSLPSASTNQ